MNKEVAIKESVPKGGLEVARKRTRCFMEFSIYNTRPITELLAYAYLQGIRDAVEVESTGGTASDE